MPELTKAEGLQGLTSNTYHLNTDICMSAYRAKSPSLNNTSFFKLCWRTLTVPREKLLHLSSHGLFLGLQWYSPQASLLTDAMWRHCRNLFAKNSALYKWRLMMHSYGSLPISLISFQGDEAHTMSTRRDLFHLISFLKGWQFCVRSADWPVMVEAVLFERMYLENPKISQTKLLC